MVKNYEGKEISDKQVKAFRKVLKANWDETLAKNPKEWDKTILEVTEGRKSLYKNGKRTFFYSWCGDWASYHLYKSGCLAKCLNRESNRGKGKWIPGYNLTLPRVWAGDPLSRRWAKKSVKNMFPKGAGAWHPWDDDADVCKDGYEPQLGDLVILPRKNGGHIEFWVNRKDKILTVSAGAQAGGVATIRTRDLDIEHVVGIIDVSKLAPSQPY
jgi:hypothetical protein